MSDTGPSQNNGWISNPYAINTIRILIVFGIVFLLRSPSCSLCNILEGDSGHLIAQLRRVSLPQSHCTSQLESHSVRTDNARQPLGVELELDADEGLSINIEPPLDLEAGTSIGMPCPVYSPGRRDRH